MPHNRIGYVRQQGNKKGQSQPLENAQVKHTFVDKATDTQRPQLIALLNSLQTGDTVVTQSMYHLAHSVDDLCCIMQSIQQKGAHVEFVQGRLNLLNTQLRGGAFILSVMKAALEFNNALARQRQQKRRAQLQQYEGKRGRKRALNPLQVQRSHQQLQQGMSKEKIAKKLGVTRQTLYRYLKEE